METTTLQRSASVLNDQFSIPERVNFREGPNGLIMVDLRNEMAVSTVSLHGAQVLSYIPKDQQDVLWVSRQSKYEEGKAIRGGIPVCWPWFGGHPTESDLPSHGFARNVFWEVLATRETPEGATQLSLSLLPSEKSMAIWNEAFRIEIHITVGEALDVALHVHNEGDAAWTYTGALHSYFHVSDIRNVSILGLDGKRYVDQLQANKPFVQAGAVKFEAETDRIYLDAPEACVLHDEGLGRRIIVAKTGSHSTVVWNPWIEKGERMADFGDLEYREMVCIETANAASDTVTVQPGASAVLGTHISLEID